MNSTATLTRDGRSTFSSVAATTITAQNLIGSIAGAAHTAGTGLSGSSYNGSVARTWTLDAAYARGLFSALYPALYTSGVFSITTASATTPGVLSAANWSTFNSKEPAISAGSSGQFYGWDKTWRTPTVTLYATAPLMYDPTNGTFSMDRADEATDGFLYHDDFAAFDAKEPAISTGTAGYWWRADKTWQPWPSYESPLTFSAPLSRSVNTISIPAASASANGHLTSTDWTTFNGKEPAISNPSDTSKYWRGDKTFQDLASAVRVLISVPGGVVPLSYNSSTGVLTMPSATTLTNGYLTATDWTTFNNKLGGGGVQGDLYYASGTGAWTLLNKNATATRYLSNTGTDNNPAWAQVNLSNGATGTLPPANGGTGQTSSFTAGAIPYGGGTNLTFDAANLFWDATNKRLGIGTNAPAVPLEFVSEAGGGHMISRGAGAYPTQFLAYKSKGTRSSPSAHSNDDSIFCFFVVPYDGSGFTSGASGSLTYYADGNHGGGNIGTGIKFEVTPQYAIGRITGLQVTSSGYLYSVPSYDNDAGDGSEVSLYINSSGAIAPSWSSGEVKTGVIDAPATATATVLDLRPVEFTRIKSGKREIGLIAEEVDQIAPQFVAYRSKTKTLDDGTTKSVRVPLTVKYDKLVVPMLDRIQRQNKQINRLQTRCDDLQSSCTALAIENNKLTKRIKAIEAKLGM